jgi:hypothetical protein
MNALMSRARSHRIDDVPNLRMAEEFGPEQSPNACLLRHADKSVAWLKQNLQTGWSLPNVLSHLSNGNSPG